MFFKKRRLFSLHKLIHMFLDKMGRWVYLGSLFVLVVILTAAVFSLGIPWPGTDTEEVEEKDEDGKEEGSYAEEEGYRLSDGSPMERKEIDDPDVYTYYHMVDDLREIAGEYPGITRLGRIGYSVEGVPLWSMAVGAGEKDVLVVGAAHAREWITTPVLIEQARTYAAHYQEGQEECQELPAQDGLSSEFCLNSMLRDYTIWFVPMLNPDGVRLVQKGSSIYPQREQELLEMNKPGMGEDFSRWKANIRGVDLNKQYDVNWEETLQLAFVDSQREVKLEPSWQNYMGEEPFSEPEARAVAELLDDEDRDFRLGLDYHSTGQFIFWYYGQEGEHLETNQRIVGAMSDYSGYGMMASGSYHEPNTCLSRYIILERGLPGATVEITPFTEEVRNMSDFDEAIENNRYMIPEAINALDSSSEEGRELP